MSDEKKEASLSPPYVSYKTFKNFLVGLKAAIPGRIDRSVMPSYSGAVQAQLMQALRFFSLIGPNGQPVQGKLPELVNSDAADRQRILVEMIKTGYPFLFGTDFDLANGTTSMLGEKFSKVSSGETVRKCITFFLSMAKDAGMLVSPHIKGAPKRSATPRAKRAKNGSAQPENKPPLEHAKTPPPTASTWSELLLAKFPSFDPTWPDEVKTKWFKSFDDLMQQGKKEGR